jgi:hypothetical protein
MADIKPEAGRIVKGLSNKSLKMSIGKKKLHGDPFLGRMLYGKLIINGMVGGLVMMMTNLLYVLNICHFMCVFSIQRTNLTI